MLLAPIPAAAQEQVIKRLRFARGGSSKIVKGQVSPEGYRYLYFFKARRGQRLTVRLVSVAGNAGHKEWSGVSPTSGDCRIEVSHGSDARVTPYTLEVSVR